ncbi:MAG: arylsulfatase [Acidobacteria bacterium]|nr:arylsulfatase [Acidobacteriota bacterium]MBI3280663.1 arylsulfatase [Acidobacteriota bacterium]
MDRRDFLKTLAGAALAEGPAGAQSRPNIVLIMNDDMGFSDLGCYGSEIRTPNIDGLANSGVRFRQFYNTARCCPTRSSILTGLYPHQTGVGHMVDNPKPFPGYTGDLNRNCVTIAEALKPTGYQTFMSGKWHVTPVTSSKHNWPRQRGFDKYYGIIHGAADYFNPVTLTRDNDAVRPDKPDYYFTDAIADNAIAYIESASRKRRPFFLYTAFTSPHWPLHAPEAEIARYRGRYKDGWDALREERRNRMIRLGIIDERRPLTPRDSRVPAWKDAPNTDWQQRRMEVYAAQIDRMDQNIGRILAALRATGQEQNTLVMFLADNGGCAEELGPKAAGLHVPRQTRDGRPVRIGNVAGIMPGAEDTYQSYGIAWANTSNTPFRLYKHWVHEGGISAPLIARWPAGIKAQGRLTSEPAHLIDIMATCLDVAGAKYPATRKGQPVTPLEGKSLRPAFDGGKVQGREAIYWEHEGNRAIRHGDWKLVSRHPDRWELYNMVADRTEMSNLAEKEPVRAERMAAAYGKWAARANVEPWEKVRAAPRTPAPIPPE